MLRAMVGTLVMASFLAACGPPSVRPASYADPEIACPGGRLAWRLQILDRRASAEGQEKVIAAVRDGIQKSFPGCRWAADAADPMPTISIEIHRFASVFDRDSWEAAVEWTVSARDAEGRTIVEFEANEEVSRPNYRGTDNEKESLSEAFRRALERTAKGLAGMSAIGALRPREGTRPGVAGSMRPRRLAGLTPLSEKTSGPEVDRFRALPKMERISQPPTAGGFL